MSVVHGTRRRFAGMMVVALFAAACTGGPKSSTTDPTDPTDPLTNGTNPTQQPGTGKPRPKGTAINTGAAGVLGIKLSQGQANTTATPTVKPAVQGEPITDDEVAAILERLPEWIQDPLIAEAFRWPLETRPRPRTGNIVEQPFPAEGEVGPPVPVVDNGPLQVVRHQPEGDIPVAPFVSITFNQPMVAIGTVAQVNGSDVPAVITPAIEGRWQWIGTRTLRFDYLTDQFDRLPQATEYTVEVPAGTSSPNGTPLAESVRWSFRTPPPQVQSFGPTSDSMPLSPVLIAAFDQRIDRQAVLDTIIVTAEGERREMRLATDDEVAADTAAAATTAALQTGRWLALTPVDPLPADARLTIDVGPGTPSAEGPRTSDKAQSYTGRTYAPLKVTRVYCESEPRCWPGSAINVDFNNQLDTAAFDPSWFSVDPAIPGITVLNYGSTASIRGATNARTKYTVTINAGVLDMFGQTLGEDGDGSVTMGNAPISLGQFSRQVTTIDPFAKKQSVSIVSTNHESLRVRIYRVTPEDWAGFAGWFMHDFQSETALPPSATPTEERVIEIDAKEDEPTETVIDLSSVLGGKPGHAVVHVESTKEFSTNSEDYWMNRPTVTWAQSTGIGLDLTFDRDQLMVWTTDLRSGAPLDGVTIANSSGDESATDSDGLATIPSAGQGPADGSEAWPMKAGWHGSVWDAIVGTLGDDSVVAPNEYAGWHSAPTDEARWFIMTDRGVYRPGETVSIKGWIRRLELSKEAQLALFDSGVPVHYNANDAFGNTIASGDLELNPLGGFDITLELKPETSPGDAYITFDLQGFGSSGYNFKVEEFRRPEFEVVTRPESEGPYTTANPATVAVDANYFAGGPLGAALVNWQVSTSAASYSPPGWEQFTFGEWRPWWFEDFGGGFAGGFGGPMGRGDFGWGPPQQPVDTQTFTGTTDAAGHHFLQLDFTGKDGELPDLPVTVSAQATVEDVNRQAWASNTDLLVHPGQLYVGLRGTRTFVKEGEPIDIEVIATDIDGALVAGRVVRVSASRVQNTFKDGEWTEELVDTQHCDTTTAGTPVACSFTTEIGGTYRIVSTIADDAGGKSRSELTRWVSGGEAIPSRNVEQEALTVIPDKADYAPGDTAQLLVQSPFASGQGLATVSRNGVQRQIRFAVVEGSAIVEIPVVDTDIPNLGVSIEVVGSTVRTADDGKPLADVPPRPAYAVGNMTLRVPPVSRTLTVDAVPRDAEASPGSDTAVDVTVTDAQGHAVAGAEFAVIVVDEAVLALTGYDLQNPLDIFYAPVQSDVSTSYGRQYLMLDNPTGFGDQADRDGAPSPTDAAAPSPSSAPPMARGLVVENASADAAGGWALKSMAYDAAAVGAGTNSPISVRTNFDALAVYHPSVTTDGNGQAVVEVKLPDNLTRYRVMVVAVDGADRFGSDESNLTARLPLMVRPSAPRFLNFGDVFEMPVVVQNQTAADMTVDVVMEADNLTLTGGAGQRITVPANDRVEIRFPMSAAQAGTAKFRVAGVSGAVADAATIELPVYTPTTAEAFATYGVLDDGATIQPVLAPTGVIPQFGGLDITTSSTSLQALTDAVLYLVQHEYDSTDSIATRLLAIAALRDVLQAFQAPGMPTPDELNAVVARDVERLKALQNDDGGFSYWRRYERTEPFNSVQVAHALVEAKRAGYEVPQDMFRRLMEHIGNIEAFIPSEYGELARRSIRAYALHVRNLNGDRDVTKAAALYGEQRLEHELDVLAWLWPLIDNASTRSEIERAFANRAVETAGAANFTTSYSDKEYMVLSSDRRTDGIVLQALISETPQSDLIPKVVTGLLGGKVKGRWENVQENAFILLALKRYFDVYEAQTPDFVANVWLGERFAGGYEFSGRTTDRSLISIPTAAMIENGDSSLTLSKNGVGRLYYRLGLRYAPESLSLEPLDRGFVVARTYEGIDDPADVTLDGDGVWHIKAGARVRVKLTMVAESQRTHAALIDPLPAGLEIQNPALATTQAAPPTEPGEPGVPMPMPIDSFSRDAIWWWGTWFDHQNMRDDRAEAFASWLPAGVYDYSYIAKATTPGTFVVPPTRAEEMYAPETFGRGGTDRVIIEG